MTDLICPACNAHTHIIDGAIKYHLRPDNLAACERSRSQPDAPKEPAAKAPAKKPARKATPKKK